MTHELHQALSFSDLNFEVQQGIINQLKAVILEDLSAEFAGDGWEEKAVRAYSIDYQMWADEEDAKHYDFAYGVDNWAYSQAETQARATFQATGTYGIGEYK